MNACACMHQGCAAAGFCIAQNPGRPIPMGTLPVYWRDAVDVVVMAGKPDDPGWCRYCNKADHTDAECWSTRVAHAR